MEEAGDLYVCRQCLVVDRTGGDCPQCGEQRIVCRPGAAGDPNRRPLIDAKGRVRSRAPRWWLHQTVGRLMGLLEKK